MRALLAWLGQSREGAASAECSPPFWTEELKALAKQVWSRRQYQMAAAMVVVALYGQDAWKRVPVKEDE